MIESLTGQGINVRHACRVLGVSESGYYDWKDRPDPPRTLRRIWLAGEIADVHKASGGTYGYMRVTAELRYGREERRPACGKKRLSDPLKGRPLAPVGPGQLEIHAPEPVRRAEIGDVGQRDLPLPEVAGKRLLGRQPALGKGPIPLGPCRLLAVGEVEGVDHLAALPARVGWWIALARELGSFVWEVGQLS